MSDRQALVDAGSGDNKNSSRYGAASLGGNDDNDDVVNRTAITSVVSEAELINSSNNSDTVGDMRSLNVIEKLGYGLGHIYNDLCAGVWFSYTLLFLQGALRISAKEAGILVMLGQVGDAIATPVIGILADKYGTKRTWHIGGTALVFMSFPLIFSICPWCKVFPPWWQPTYFAICILAFQLGWAIVQITHLSMIPELSRTNTDRSDLTAIRYSASICSNVVVYMVTWAVLHGRAKDDNNIGPGDAFRFRDISLILTLAGLSMTVLFHFSLSMSNYEIRRRLAPLPNQARGQFDTSVVAESGTPSVSSSSTSSGISSEDAPDENTSLIKPHIKVRRFDNGKFLRSPLLYQNAFLYVFSRLFMTTSLIYMPLWLDERAWTPPASNSSDVMTLIEEAVETNAVEHLATVPLVSFVASFISSILLKYCSRLFGHQMAYFIGSLFCIGGCLSVYFVTPTTSAVTELFGIAILFGAGSSVTMISSLCITADMIGSHSEKGGFIYSAVTFFDKLITGIVVAVIESVKCQDRSDCPTYYRNVLAYGCGAACILGLCILLTLQCTKRSQRRQSNMFTS